MDHNWVRPRWSQRSGTSPGQGQDQDQIWGLNQYHGSGPWGVLPRLGQGSYLGIITRPTRARQVKPSPTVWTASQVHILWPSPVLLHTA